MAINEMLIPHAFIHNIHSRLSIVELETSISIVCYFHCASIPLFIWLRDLDSKNYSRAFGGPRNVMLEEKIKWSEKVTNEVLELMEDKGTLLNNILRRKANWIVLF